MLKTIRWFRQRHGAAAAVLLLASAAAAPAFAAPQVQLSLQPTPTLDTHTRGNKHVAFGLTLLNGETANAPFTLRFDLPPHVTVRHAPQNNPTQWSCTWTTTTLTCVYGTSLFSSMYQSSGLQIEVDVDGDLPVPGNSVLRATLESAQLPLPPQPVCTDSTPTSYIANSTTGCVARTVAHRRSQVVFLPEQWSRDYPEFEAGSTNVSFYAGFSNQGFTQAHQPVTARFLLPPGITYRSVWGIVQWTCSAAAPDAQGQLVTCTTAYFFDGMGPHQANIGLRVDVAPDVAVPGPLPIFATISNPDQPPPAFSLCDDPAPPIGCGYYTIPTRAARVSRMDILDMQPFQPLYNRGDEARVDVTYSNVGEGNATAATLAFAVPPGFAYTHNSASPPINCTVVAGSAATGETLECRYAASYPAGVAGFVYLHFDVLRNAAPSSLFIGSASDDGMPGPSLAQCIADPASPEPMLGCGRTTVQVSPWIFCDGFEDSPHRCGTRQQP